MAPSIATITSKGQITVPRAVREALGLSQGDPVLFEEQDGLIVIRKRPRPDPAWDASVSATLSEWEDDLDEGLIAGLRGSLSDHDRARLHSAFKKNISRLARLGALDGGARGGPPHVSFLGRAGCFRPQL